MMGRLFYETDVRLDMDDRTLAHLELVIATKLRRGEAFMFSWAELPASGSGRTAVWIHPEAAVGYRYDHARRSPLNPGWIEALAIAANSPGGLYLVPEPSADHIGDEDAA